MKNEESGNRKSGYSHFRFIVNAALEGYSLFDKIIILVSLFLYGLFRFIPKHLGLLKKSSGAFYGELILKDVRIRNGDGIFVCRKKSSDCPIVSNITERELREYFKLDKGVFVNVGHI